MKLILKLVGVLIIIGALAGAVYLVRKNQETRRGAAIADTSSSILPSAVNVDPGKEFTVNLWVNTGSQDDKLAGGEFVMSFDPLVLELMKIEAADQSYNLVDQPDIVVANGLGRVQMAAVAMDGEKSGAMALVKLTFKALSGGQVILAVEPTSKLMMSGQEQEWDIGTSNKSIVTVGGPVVTRVPCVPRPRCLDGIFNSAGEKIYCDPQPLAPGQVYCKGTAGEGEMCGGFRGIMCAEGLICKMKDGGGIDDGRMHPMIADSSGVCVKETCVPKPACIDGVETEGGAMFRCELLSKVNYCADKPCGSDEQCGPGQFCSHPPVNCPAGATCMKAAGVCRAKENNTVGEGGVCGGFTNTQCQSGLICDYGGGVEDGRMRPMIAKNTGICRKAPSGVNCGWCGASCVDTSKGDLRCPMMPQPAGQECINKDGRCTIISSGTTGGTCGQRCTSKGGCGEGLTCVPIWWPCDGPIAQPMMSELSNNSGLARTEVESLIKRCPKVRQVLPDDYQAGERIKMPTFYGVCRSASCPNIPNCNCGIVGPTSTPIPTSVSLQGDFSLQLSRTVNNTANVGDKLILNVAADVYGNNKISAVNTKINYDPASFEVVEIQPEGRGQELKKEVDAVKGTITLYYTWNLPATGLFNRYTVANIILKAKTAGAKTIAFDPVYKHELAGLDAGGGSVAFSPLGFRNVNGFMISEVVKCQVCTSGISKLLGNANCDGAVNLTDFEFWRSEMFDKGGINNLVRLDWKADYNCDSKVSLSDFEIWRNTVFK